MSSEEPRDDRLGAALSELPVPDHGPTFWAVLTDRLSETQPVRAEGETTVPFPTGSATDAGPADPLAADTVSLEDHRARRDARRGGRLNRPLGAAAAAVALIVAVAGGLTFLRQDDKGSDIRAAERPTGTTGPGTTAAAAPAEFSATYDGVEGFDGPDGCCSQYRLTVANDGSYRWTSTDGGADMAYDATTSRHVEVVTRGEGASKQHPNAFVSSGVPVGGPFQGVKRPDPLSPIADFVLALARANDSRVTATTVAGRPAWHYDGPVVQDRLGGDGAPNHAVADVDQASGVLLQLTRRVGDQAVTRFTASDVMIGDQVDRSRYQLKPPPGSKTTPVTVGFVPTTLDKAAAGLPYQLLVPTWVPEGFTLDSVNSVAVDREVGAPTGPEGVNAPSKPVVNMTWRRGALTFTVTLRPSEGHPDWNDPLGQEGLVLDAQPVRLPLNGRPPLEGQVAVDAPVEPHVWGVTGDVVVTVSGDLPRAELERVAGSLQPHRARTN
jgi:hypothetical protein